MVRRLRFGAAGSARNRLGVLVLSAVIGACGGGGDGGTTVGSDSAGNGSNASANQGSSATLPQAAVLPTPTTKAASIDFQYQRMDEFRNVLAAMQDGDADALEALQNGRHADWDAYWQTTYPALVDRLRIAAENLDDSEDHIQRLIYGFDTGTANQGANGKVVPVPIVLLAVATATYIYKEEQKRLAGHSNAPTKADQDAFIDNLAEIYKKSGLSDVAARTRAIADAAQVDVLRGLQTGIDHARSFVFNSGVKPGFSVILPPGIKNALSLDSIRRRLGDIKDNVQAILTSKECRTVVPARAKVLTEPGTWGVPAFEKAANSCQVYFCTTNDAVCDNLPDGDWEAAVLTSDHLRDVDLDVSANGGQTVTVAANPLPADQIEDPAPLATCSRVQNAGGDQPDTRTVPLGATSGTITFSHEMYRIKDRIKLLYDGRTLFDTGCVSGSATRMIPFSGQGSFITVQVEPNCSGNTSGTAWNYSVSCPGN